MVVFFGLRHEILPAKDSRDVRVSKAMELLSKVKANHLQSLHSAKF